MKNISIAWVEKVEMENKEIFLENFLFFFSCSDLCSFSLHKNILL